MKNVLYGTLLCAGILIAGACSTGSQQTSTTTDQLNHAKGKLALSLEMLNDTSLNPRNMEEGQLRLVQSRDWTSGFFPGMLWMMYEYSGGEEWKRSAHHYSMNIEQEKLNGRTHDMGFKMFCSFGHGYRLTGDQNYREILLQSASTLITRFNPRVGCIRSWDHNSDKWDYPVIIDNMMNLELLFWATRETRDSTYYKVAVQHAKTTMENHFRDDFSSYHVISYDTLTGEVVKRNTHQGFSHESAWARGQAWGLYGYTMTFRETGEKQFLEQAKAIARYLLDHPNLPADKVPYWDYDAPGQPAIPRDVSAAAIMASALYELSTYCPESKIEFTEVADQILKALSSEYIYEGEEGMPFLLEHSVGHLPHDSEIDVPIIYADYYYLEALLRKMKLTGDWNAEKADIIIKVDDLRYDAANVVPERWEKFATYMEIEKVPASIGLICESIEKGDQSYHDWITDKQETGLFEFWNHGLDHSKGSENGAPYWEFRNQSREKQQKHLLYAQKLASEKLGLELVTFGAPYNQSDQVTAEVLEEIKEIKNWLYPPSGVTTSKTRLERLWGVNIEYPVHNPSSYQFWNNFYFNSNTELLVIQGHPNSWDERRFHEFEGIIQYLKLLNLEVILPRDLQQKS